MGWVLSVIAFVRACTKVCMQRQHVEYSSGTPPLSRLTLWFLIKTVTSKVDTEGGREMDGGGGGEGTFGGGRAIEKPRGNWLFLGTPTLVSTKNKTNIYCLIELTKRGGVL